MTTRKPRLLASLTTAIVVLGGSATGLCIYSAVAADPPKSVGKQATKPTDQPLVDKPSLPKETTENASGPDILQKPLKMKLGGDGSITLGEIIEAIEAQNDLIVRIDVDSFHRLEAFPYGDEATNFENGPEGDLWKRINATKVILPRRADKLPLRDVLKDAMVQIRLQRPCTYQVRGSQIVIIPAYVPPLVPGENPLEPKAPLPGMDADDFLLPQKAHFGQIYGAVVSVSAERKPLAAILSDLQKQTGANIVLDPRCDAQEKKPGLTVTLNDVRLYDALRVIADMAEMKMVYVANIYYVTTPMNAKAFQPPTPPRPAVAAHPSPPGGFGFGGGQPGTASPVQPGGFGGQPGKLNPMPPKPPEGK